MKKIFTLFALLICINVAWAQTVSYSTAGSNYSQDFDGLASAGSAIIAATSGPFEITTANFAGSNVPGWYVERYAGSGTNVALAVGDGSSNSGQHYSFGAAAATERALGSLASGTRVGRMGVILTNNTGATLNSITISFVTEMWRKGNGAVAHVYPFSYKVNGTNINDATGFVTETSLNLVTPNLTGTNDLARNGNDPAFRAAVTQNITGISWPAGQTLVLRWDDVNETGNDDALAIDDFVFSASASASPVLNATPSTITVPNTTVGTASAAATYSLTGSNLSGAAVTVTAPTNFEVSTDGVNYAAAQPVAYTAPNLSATISVRLTAAAPTGNYSGQLIANTGGGAAAVNVTASGNVFPAEPTVQATNVIISNVGNTGFDVNWTNGNGASRIVTVRTGAKSAPVDGTGYAIPGNTGSGNNIYYIGSGSGPLSITGLVPGTSYTVQVYEFNGTGSASNYLDTDATGNPAGTTTTGALPTLVKSNFTAAAAPQFAGSGNTTRLPVMYYATVSGLKPTTTYRFYTQAEISANFGAAAGGAGLPVNIDYTQTSPAFSYSSTGSLTTAGSYGKFTTNASGSFSGSFGYVNSGNAERFSTNNYVYPTITLGEEATYINTQYRFALNDSIKILEFDVTSTDSTGSFIKGESTALPGNLVGLWSTVDGNLVAQRPLAMTLSEGVSFSGPTAWASSFIAGYDQNESSWNTIIPNQNANGVRLIQQFDLRTGQVLGCNSDADGVWPSGANTVNPITGTTAIQITEPDATLTGGSCFGIVLPVRISSFAVQKQGTSSKISWTTEQEINSKEFVVERSTDQRVWTVVATVAAAGSSASRTSYSATDFAPAKGINFYRLRMVDVDNRFENSATKSVLFSTSDVVLITPNPATTSAIIYMGKNNNSLSQIFVTDMNGKLVERINTADQTHTLQTARYSKGLYMIRVVTEGNTSTHKLVVQ